MILEPGQRALRRRTDDREERRRCDVARCQEQGGKTAGPHHPWWRGSVRNAVHARVSHGFDPPRVRCIPNHQWEDVRDARAPPSGEPVSPGCYPPVEAPARAPGGRGACGPARVYCSGGTQRRRPQPPRRGAVLSQDDAASRRAASMAMCAGKGAKVPPPRPPEHGGARPWRARRHSGSRLPG